MGKIQIFYEIFVTSAPFASCLGAGTFSGHGSGAENFCTIFVTSAPLASCLGVGTKSAHGPYIYSSCTKDFNSGILQFKPGTYGVTPSIYVPPPATQGSSVVSGSQFFPNWTSPTFFG